MKYLMRGLKIFSYGLVITLVTWIFLREGFIIFGILHLIGISIILAYPFLKLRFQNLFLGILLIFFGICLQRFTVDSYWLIWLGFTPSSLYTIDYFPILPWFGVVLIGLFFGNLLYPSYKRRFNLIDLSNFSFIKLLNQNRLPFVKNREFGKAGLTPCNAWNTLKRENEVGNIIGR